MFNQTPRVKTVYLLVYYYAQLFYTLVTTALNICIKYYINNSLELRQDPDIPQNLKFGS